MQVLAEFVGGALLVALLLRGAVAAAGDFGWTKKKDDRNNG